MPRDLPALAQLEAFEATARLSSVSRAAEELRLTQSAVSRKIILLEARLNTALFARRAKRMVLTDAGVQYLQEVRRGLAVLSAASSTLTHPRLGTEFISISIPPTFGGHWLIPRLSRFCAANPEVNLTITTRLENFGFSFDAIDCAIHFGEPDWPGTVAQFMSHETIGAVGVPELVERVKTPDDLAGLPILQLTARPLGWRDWLISVHARAVSLQPRFTVDSVAMAVEMVRAGLAVAALPTFLVEEDLRAGALSVVLQQRFRSRLAYYLVYPQDTPVKPAVRAFSDWLARELTDWRRQSGEKELTSQVLGLESNP